MGLQCGMDNRLRAAMLPAVLGAALVGCVQATHDRSAGPNDVPFAPLPDPDPFYWQPDPLPRAAPGTILKSRAVTFDLTGASPMPYPAWQLQFMSRDVLDRPVAAIATVIKPRTAPGAATPLLAAPPPEDSLGSLCAPSHTLAGNTSNSNNQMDVPNWLPGLEAGWTIVVPDHEGPYSAYGAARLHGQITLDAIRAALAFDPLELAPDAPIGVWGYSGGATAAAFAGALHAAYAPELGLVAVASGGLAADAVSVARHVENDPAVNAAIFSIILSAVEGINRAYPEFVTPILNDRGRAAFESLRDGCVGATTDGSPAPTGRLADFTTHADPYDSPGVRRIAPLVSLPLAGHPPVVPVFVYHSLADEIVPVAGADALVDAWCEEGVQVEYYRGASGEHVSFASTAAPLVLAYLAGRFGSGPFFVPPGTKSCNVS